MSKHYLLLCIILSLTVSTFGQSFTFHSVAPFGIQPTREDSSRAVQNVMFFDYDGDQDLDLFLAGLDVIDNFDNWEGVHYFIEMQENIGDRWNPLFGERTEVFDDFPFPLGYFFPAIGDLNADGKPDFIINGEVNYYGDRTIHYLESNEKSAGVEFDVVTGEAMGLPSFGAESAFFPELVDLDLDGDLDLLASGFNAAFAEEDGPDIPRYHYARNIGTTASPDFEGWYSDPYGLIPVPVAEEVAAGDIDNDGDVDLLGAGILIPADSINHLFVHLNTPGPNQKPAFSTVMESPFGLPSSFGTMQFAFPELVDLDGDGDLDLFVFVGGALDLQLQYYENNLCTGSITTLNVFLCDGDAYFVGDQSFTEEGGYTIILEDVNGCDSTIFLGISIYPVFDIDVIETVCEGESVMIGGNVYSESGIYTIELQDINGCDSTIFLDLTVNEVFQTDVSEVICRGEVVTIGGTDYSETGDYITTLLAGNGCDSIVFLSLTVFETDETQVSESICEGESLVIGGFTFNEAGDYVVVLKNMHSCDSTVLLSLEVNEIFTTGIEATICDGDVFSIGLQDFTEAGQYQLFLFSQSGCDSVIALDLTVIVVDNSVSLSENVLTASLSDAMYQWIDCDSGNDIAGATNQSFEVMSTGNYAVRITDANGCMNESECMFVVITSVQAQLYADAITLYPNPADDIVSVRNTSTLVFESITLMNASGASVAWFDLNGNQTADISHLTPGVYFARIVVKDVVVVKKVVVI